MCAKGGQINGRLTFRTGGWPWGERGIKNIALTKHPSEGAPVALSNWSEWRGEKAPKLQTSISGRLMEGMVDKSSRNVYKGLFDRWSCRRYALGKPPYLSSVPGSEETNEGDVIAYVVINLGPLERDAGEIQNRRRAIGYSRKVREGVGPLKGMARLQNPTRGARQEKGQAKGKMPATAEDLNKIKDTIDWGNPDSAALRCEVSIACFFYVEDGVVSRKQAKKGEEGEVGSRRPLLME